jgi:hypothetical protein
MQTFPDDKQLQQTALCTLSALADCLPAAPAGQNAKGNGFSDAHALHSLDALQTVTQVTFVRRAVPIRF